MEPIISPDKAFNDSEFVNDTIKRINQSLKEGHRTINLLIL